MNSIFTLKQVCLYVILETHYKQVFEQLTFCKFLPSPLESRVTKCKESEWTKEMFLLGETIVIETDFSVG